MIDVGDANCLVYTISDSEKFGFCGSNIYCLIDSLDYWTIVWINIWNWGSCIILNTGVHNNNRGMRVIGSANSDGIKILHIALDIMSTVMKRKTISKRIYKSTTQRKFVVK